MPKATLQFNLPEDRYDYDSAIHGGDWRLIVFELATFLREKLKYGHTYKTADEALEAVKLELWDSCNEYHLDPWSD